MEQKIRELLGIVKKEPEDDVESCVYVKQFNLEQESETDFEIYLEQFKILRSQTASNPINIRDWIVVYFQKKALKLNPNHL